MILGHCAITKCLSVIHRFVLVLREKKFLTGIVNDSGEIVPDFHNGEMKIENRK
jgi:hypothetical protein